MSKRSYERARQAIREGDPYWRNWMPISWHLSRHWDIYWPAYATIGVLLAAIAVMMHMVGR